MAKKYNEEFKKEAVRLVIKNDKKVKIVAQELDVNYWTLKDWVRNYGKELNAELIEQGLKVTPEEEIRTLKKELAEAQEESAILKKAIAVFSKKPNRNMSL